MSFTPEWTILRLLQWTSDYLKEHGTESPRLDAEVLLAHACGCQRIDLYTRYDQLPESSVRDRFRELVKKRATGVPVAYLVGYREFYSLRFRVTPDVLIPRPETEFVLVALMDRVKLREQGESASLRVADIGTGSGVLAICAARQLSHAHLVAVDVSESAIALAKENATSLGVQQQIEFHTCDLFEQLPNGAPFDFILSNPPYIGRNERAQLPRDVVEHEPATALFAGETGTEVLTRLIDQAAGHLAPHGWLLTEINPLQHQFLADYMQQSGRYTHIGFVDDLAKQPRVLCGQVMAKQ